MMTWTYKVYHTKPVVNDGTVGLVTTVDVMNFQELVIQHSELMTQCDNENLQGIASGDKEILSIITDKEVLLVRIIEK